MYYKGMKSNGMVERLDIDRIVQSVHTELEPLYKVLGIYWIGKKVIRGIEDECSNKKAEAATSASC